MRVGVIGAGRIGGNCARQAVKAGHEVMLSFARDAAKLESLASELGVRASTGSVAEAAGFGSLVFPSVPWGGVPGALGQPGTLTAQVVVDPTSQLGARAIADR